MRAEKHVLLAIPVLSIGGTEIQTLCVLRVLVKAGYQVTVLCYYEFTTDVVRQFETEGAEVILLGLDRSDGRFGFVRILELISRLGCLFRELRPDIVHVQYVAPGLIPIVAARLAGVSTVFATVHIAGSIAYGRKNKFLLRAAACLCDAFFCVSRGVEEFWFGSSCVFDPAGCFKYRRHLTIYNAMDVGRIEATIRQANREALRQNLELGKGPVLGIVGRLAEQKGHVILLDALCKIVHKFPQILLLVVGDGPERTTLRGKAECFGLEGHIRWLGSLPQEQVFELYAVMDIFVMPSLYEGFGLTAAEAMAAGLSVVATEVAGLSEVIEDGVTGYLVPVGDVQGLADKLIRLLTDPHSCSKMGQKGQERVSKLFSMERFSKSTLAAYKLFAK